MCIRDRFEAIKIDELAEAGIEQNPPDRCYRCKRLLFEKLQAFANEKGIALLCDGTNADDLKEYRPGLCALRELGVHSPLMECSLSKNEVRALAKEAGLAVSQKPSSPCLLYTSGSRNAMGEVGHGIMYPGGRPCSCGQRGCAERYVSGTALWTSYNDKAAGERIHSGYEFFELYRQEDARAIEVLNQYIWDFSCLLYTSRCV